MEYWDSGHPCHTQVKNLAVLGLHLENLSGQNMRVKD